MPTGEFAQLYACSYLNPLFRVLRYVKPAVGVTDVPDGLPEFISQRRRWLNGSFFAAVYAIAHTPQILWSGHSTGRKTALMLETVYNIINLVFAWFGIVSFYNSVVLAFRLTTNTTGKLLFILCE